MLKSFSKAIVLAPHTDDIELGCGGTISKLISLGVSVEAFIFSSCEESVPEPFPKDTLKKESILAGKELGLKEEDINFYSFRVRHFPAQRQEILEELIKIRARCKPDLVLVPASWDVHQDHQVIYKEGVRAFKHATILGYEMPWNNFSFSNDCFIQLGEGDLKRKISAISEYKTQAHRKYTSEYYIRALATTRALQCNKHYAETFEVIRWIIS